MHAEMPVSTDYEKEQSAVRKRIAALGEKIKNSKVVEKMKEEAKERDPELMQKKYKEWNIVSAAYDAARDNYMSEESKPISTCLLDLANVLRTIATTGGVDKQNNPNHNSNKESEKSY